MEPAGGEHDMTQSTARILVVGHDSGDADLVRRLLKDEHASVDVSTDPERYAADFDRCRPQVLVLAFRSLEETERYYLGLYRNSAQVNATAHRTLILCGKDDVVRAYELCRDNYFDDYVLFWPMSQDGRRLPMAVRLALRMLDTESANASMAQLASQARRIAELEEQLARQLALGRAHADQARASVEDAQARVGSAIDGLSQRVLDDGLERAVDVRDPARVRQALGRFSETEVQPPLRAAVEAVRPVQQWVGSLEQELGRPMHAVRAIAEQTRDARSRVMVVDDDEFVQKLMSRVLSSAGYDVVAVGSVGDAMTAMRRQRPDLILMDVNLPDIDGIHATRRLKAAQAYAGIPVIMLTGQSEKQTIVQSLGAGAADFVVKPFDRDNLLQKVARWLNG